MARIPPLPPEEWSPEMSEAIAALRPENPRHPLTRRKGGPKALNALGTLARHPELAKAFNTFNGHILFSSTLSPRQRELLVLRVASVRESEYEWAQHAILAGDVGLDADEVARIAVGPDAPGWSTLDGAMVRAVDELIGAGHGVRRAPGPSWPASSTNSSSWTWSSPSGPTRSWPWPSAPSGSSSTRTSGGNELLFFEDW